MGDWEIGRLGGEWEFGWKRFGLEFTYGLAAGWCSDSQGKVERILRFDQSSGMRYLGRGGWYVHAFRFSSYMSDCAFCLIELVVEYGFIGKRCLCCLLQSPVP